MSFGVSIGDLLAVLKLAQEVRRTWKDAPTVYKEARKQTKNLSNVLVDLGQILDNIVLTESQTKTLHSILSDCKALLQDIQTTVAARPLESGSRLQKEWNRFRANPDDVRVFQEQIAHHISLLLALQNSIQIGLSRKTAKDVCDLGVDLKAGLRGLEAGLKADRNEEKRQKIDQWLSTAGYAEQQNQQLEERQTGTATWFLQHPLFTNWCDKSSQTLFCPGIPGSGKTVISATVIDELQHRFEKDNDIAVAYFYCNHKRQDEQSLQQILAALLQQLLKKESVIPDDVEALYNKHASNTKRPSIQELKDLILSFTRTRSKTFILVDALDEYQNNVRGETREDFLAYLIELQSQTGVNVNIMATSRPGIVRAFETHPQIEIRAHPEDIRLYLHANAAAIVPCVERRPHLVGRIAETIAGNADGMFLLARLHLHSLRNKTNVRTLERTLSSLPRGANPAALDQAYSEVLSRIKHSEGGFDHLALKALAWLTHARRELNMEELREALAIEPDMTDIDPENDLDDATHIISACAGLVIVDGESGAVRFAHYTIQEYLERHQDEWLSGSDEDIAKDCITYLSMQALHEKGTDWGMQIWDLAQQYKLLRYVGEHWPFHLRNIKDVDNYVSSVLCNRELQRFATQLMLSQYNVSARSYHCETRDIGPLHTCSYSNNHDAIQYLLNEGLDGDKIDSNGDSALHYAARYGTLEAVNKLLAHPSSAASLNLQNNVGDTALSIAAYAGHTNIVHQLLASPDISVNLHRECGRTALWDAIDKGHIDIVVRLLAHKDIAVSLNQQNHYGETPLLHAAAYRHEIAAQLLAHPAIGASINLPCEDGKTPLCVAVSRKGCGSLIDQFLAREDITPSLNFWRAGPDSSVFTPLLMSLFGDQYEPGITTKLLARQEVRDGIDLFEEDMLPVLHTAAWVASVQTMTELLAISDRCLNLPWSPDRATPLYIAAERERSDIVALLLAHPNIDISVNYESADGHIPLTMALQRSNDDIVGQLLPRTTVTEGTKLAQKLDYHLIDWRQFSKLYISPESQAKYGDNLPFRIRRECQSLPGPTLET